MNLTDVAAIIALLSAGVSIGIWVHTRNLASAVAEKLGTTLREPLRDIKNSLDQINQSLGQIDRVQVQILGRTTSKS